jgi:pepF/M3 family oligoendopeptidase
MNPVAESHADEIPQWDLSPLYGGLEADDFHAALEQLRLEQEALAAFYDRHDVRRRPVATQESDSDLAAVLVEALQRTNALLVLADTLEAFAHGHLTTNSYDAAAQRAVSQLEQLEARRHTLSVRLAGFVGALQERLAALIAAHPVLSAHAFFLHETAEQSRFLMPEELEALAAELCVDGGAAFGKLQGNITSQLRVPLQRDGQVEHLPITVVRNLCYSSDAALRQRAYHAEIAGWASIQTPVAAALNAVKGTALTLARRRGRASVLEQALVDNRIDQPTLDALLEAIREAFPVFRRYLKRKAHRLGHEQLAWWDLFAPLESAQKHFTWREARDFIVRHFRCFSTELGEFAAAAFDHRWIDALPRDGKRGGAYCMSVLGIEESRILANFDGSFDQVFTLAHELGHAFHNQCQRGLPALQRGAPSTLAETASTFCETLVAEAALAEAEPAEQLAILETQLQGATQLCLDIYSRFLFESRFLEQRQHGELAPEEICRLMLQCQRDTYADAVRPDTYHRYMWLWKPHYYSYAHNFYNFPYAFGHLFALGLYALYGQRREAFVPQYVELLRETGRSRARPLAQRFGIDIAQKEFWRQSLQTIASQVERYEQV